MEAIFEWMYQARHDASLMGLYQRLVAWVDVPMNEPMLLEVVVDPTTDELEEVVITDNE
jgi:hypothetical protein